MQSIGTPIAAALDADAPRVECAVKRSVSTPDALRMSLIQRATVEPVTLRNGRLKDMRRDPLFVSFLTVSVRYT